CRCCQAPASSAASSAGLRRTRRSCNCSSTKARRPARFSGRGAPAASPRARRALRELLVDKSAAAGAILEKSGAGGIVAGHGDGTLRLRLVSPLVKIDLGERVPTAGPDGSYPQGFFV